MNYINVFYRLCLYLPKFITKYIAKLLILKNKQWKAMNIKFHFQKCKKNQSNKNLVMFTHDGAVGDLITLTRFLYQCEQEKAKFDLLSDIKHKEFLEKFNFKNIKIYYYENKIISHNEHYIKKKQQQDKINDLNGDFKFPYSISEQKYKKVFTFQHYLNTLSMLFLQKINYEKCFLWKQKTLYTRGKKMKGHIPFFFDYSRYILMTENTPILFALLTLINFKKFNFKFFGNKECKFLYVADLAYFSYFNKLPIKSLSSLDLSNYFKIDRKNIKQKSLIIMIDDRIGENKRLKLQYLIDYINAYFSNYNVTFVGNGPKFMKELFNKKQECKFKIIDKVNKTKTLMDLINEVNKNENVLAYDTSILHIAMLLNKKTTLIINNHLKHNFFRWHNYQNKKLKITNLDVKKFY